LTRQLPLGLSHLLSDVLHTRVPKEDGSSAGRTFQGFCNRRCSGKFVHGGQWKRGSKHTSICRSIL